VAGQLPDEDVELGARGIRCRQRRVRRPLRREELA
jgi:hypothetical protein